MRLPNTRRGAHPKHRSQSDPGRAWFLDETTGDYSPSVWGDTTQNLGPHDGGVFVTDPILPYIVDSPVGMAKRFVKDDITAMSTSSSSTDAESQSILTTQDATFAAWVYLEDVTDFSTLVRFSSARTAAPVAADNILLRISFTSSNGNVDIITQEGASVTTNWRGDYQFPLNRWVYMCIVRSPNGVSQINNSLYVNGRFIENLNIINAGAGNTPSDGSDAYWQFGGQYNSGSGGAMENLFTGRLAGAYLWDRQLTADEMEEDYRRGLLLPFHTSSQVRVAVEKPEPAPGTTSLYYDATQLDGLDFVSELNTSNSPDNACVQGSVKFLREQENLSLAYLKNDTKLNLVEPTSYGSVERFLDVYRQIRIFAATVPLGLDASGDDYWYMLDGRIDLIDWGTEEVTVNFRDKGGLLVDTFIEDEAIYGTTDPLSPVIVNTVIDDIVDANSDAVKTDSYPDPGAVIYNPPPGAAWAVDRFIQKREPVLVAIRTIAGQFGHDVKFKWYDPSESFRLQLYQPERDSVTLSAIFSPAEIKSISKAELASQRVRNVVRVSYDSNEIEADQIANVTGITLPASITLNPPFPANGTVNGTTTITPSGEEEPTPAYVELQNSSSMLKYGRRFMEVQESSTSNINLGTEATRMALSMIQDLSEPEFDHSITVPLIPFLDIHDIIGFQPNAYLYSADQYLAVSQITHNFTEEATTTMSVRGQPNLGVRRWMALESRGAPIPSNAPQEASTPLTKSEKLASLQSVLDKSQMNLGGKFTQVRNNAFMTWSNGRLNPPTGWSMDPLGGSWDNVNIRADGVSKTGALSVEFNDNTYVLVSDYIPIDGFRNQPYVLEATYKVVPTTAVTLDAEVSFYEADGTFIRTGGVPGGLGAPLAVNEWQTERGYFQPEETLPGNNDARYARIRVRKGSAVAGSVYLDNVSLYPAAAACMVKYLTGSTWDGNGVDPAGSSNIKNIQCSDTSGTSYYDYIGNVVDDSASPTPNDGTHFVVPATGIYDVFCQSAFNVSVAPLPASPISAGDNINILMYAFIDAQYGAGGIISSATRTVLKQQTTFTCPDIAASANSDLNGFASVSGSFFAQAGDKISFGYGSSGSAYYPTGSIKSGDVTITNILDLTGADPSSYFSVKQRLLD